MIASVALSLSECALRTVADSVLGPVGIDGVGLTVSWLRTHIADPSRKLETALQNAMDQTWRALELALAGDSFLDRCKGALASCENKGFADQLRQYLDYAKLHGQSDAALARDARRELRAARVAKHFTTAANDLRALEKAVDFRRFNQPGEVASADVMTVQCITEGLRGLGYARLAELLDLRPAQGRPLIIVAVQYFFRRRLESDAELCRGLTLGKLDKLEAGQQQAFAATRLNLQARDLRYPS